MGVASRYALDRMVHVDGEMKDTMVDERKALSRLAEADPAAPILLVIASTGGAVMAASALRDRIALLRGQGTVIDGLVEGVALSGAVVLLQACAHRLAGPAAVLGVHGVSYTVSNDDLMTHRSEMREIDAYTAEQSRLLASRTSQPERYWRRLLARNEYRYYSADEALAVGLIDEIILPQEAHARDA